MLTDTACRNAACPADRKRERLADSGGLYLEVSLASKRWFCKYRHGGKERRLALGAYPDVGLKAARLARDDAKKLLQTGIDPAHQRKADANTRATRAAVTFEAVAREYHAQRKPVWSAAYAAQWLHFCEKDLFPWIGARPLGEITAPELLGVLRKVTDRGAVQVAKVLREIAGQVFRFGIATGRAERDPAADLRDALPNRVERHHGALLDPQALGALLRDMAAYKGQPTTRAALVLSALLFQRPGNIRAMEWTEVDLEAGMWAIPAAKMKRSVAGKVNGRPHLVPLAPQAVAILKELKPLTDRSRYVFPHLSTRERCMSGNTLRVALRAMGYGNEEQTAHGFRATARTILVEKVGVDPDVIEAQLAHGKSGPLGMAYDRAEFLEQRRQMMVTWAEYLDRLREGAQTGAQANQLQLTLRPPHFPDRQST